jgi:hypothetical protein
MFELFDFRQTVILKCRYEQLHVWHTIAGSLENGLFILRQEIGINFSLIKKLLIQEKWKMTQCT